MFMEFKRVWMMLLVLNTMCSVVARHVSIGQTAETRNSKSSTNISFNQCNSGRVCVHGVCNFSNLKCVCYNGWTGELCDQLITQPVFSTERLSHQLHPKSNGEENLSKAHMRNTLTNADTYLAELLSLFFPRFREYFKMLIALGIPCTQSSLISPNAKASSILDVAPTEIKTANIPTVPDASLEGNVAGKTGVINANQNNFVKNAGVGKKHLNLNDNELVRQAKANLGIAKRTSNTLLTNFFSPRRTLNRKTSPRYVNNMISNHNRSLANSVDISSESSRAAANKPVNNDHFFDLNAHSELLGEGIEEIEQNEEVCQNDYKLRPLTERMCTPGLVCKYGTCSSEHKGSYIAFECSCDSGAVGLMCEQKCCMDCGGNGRCDIYYDGSEQCACKRGYHGLHCELSDSETIHESGHISSIITVHSALSNVL